MKGDFSRDTFDARKHYAAVLQQQGRVQVDADWNEQQQIHAHRAERTATDVIGASGAPDASSGFALSFTPDQNDLVIAPGRFYVDGILCELDADDVLPFTSAGDANVECATDRPDLVDLRAGQWVAFAADGGAVQTGRIVSVSIGSASVKLVLDAAVARPASQPAGTLTGSLQRVVTYLTQPDLPNPTYGQVAGNGVATLGLDPRPYLVYLDVWKRFIGAIDDPSIREVALGGADTAARSRTVAQVKLLPVTWPQTGAMTATTAFAEWDALVAPSTGRLSARSAPSEGQASACLLPPGGGYQGLENQLYRVEIWMAASSGTYFVWSRDNATVAMSVLAFSGTVVTLDTTGPDDALGLANGQTVEIIGDAEELAGIRGQLMQIATVDVATATITFDSAPTPIDARFHPKVRRWDGFGQVPAAGGTWLELEKGVQVAFTSGSYTRGDHWIVPARSGAVAAIEWDHVSPQPAAGTRHHYARLGMLVWNANAAGRTLVDWRSRFAPLTDVPRALHVTGISWSNDDVVQVDQFASGLSITLDGTPPATYSVVLNAAAGNTAPTDVPIRIANDASVVVTIELPVTLPDKSTTMPVPVVMKGQPIQWDATTNTMTWVPDNASQAIVQSAGAGRALVRVRLVGRYIWSDLDQQRLFLDGESFGRPGLSTSQGNTLRTDLVLPSGTGRRFSDFESWFFLQFADTPVSLRQVTLQSVRVYGQGNFYVIGQTTFQAVVQLVGPARQRVAVNVGGAVDNGAAQIAVNGGAPLFIEVGESAARFDVAISNCTASASATVTVAVPALANSTQLITRIDSTINVIVLIVRVTPQTAPLISGSSIKFSATVASGPVIPMYPDIDTSVRWSCSGGSIDQNGLYGAPLIPGTYTVTATSVADPARSDQATVTVSTKVKDADTKNWHLDLATKLADHIAFPIGPIDPGPQIGHGPLIPTSPLLGHVTPLEAFIEPAERPVVGPAARVVAAEPADVDKVVPKAKRAKATTKTTKPRGAKK